ncbi:MAG: DUF4397 domain-containing protein [Glaciecola sp.]
MKLLRAIPLAVLTSLFLMGCDSDDDPIEEVAPELMQVRVIHASPDAPTVDIFAGTTAIDALDDVDYQVASGFLSLESGDYELRAVANLPLGETLEVINADVTLMPDTDYNVLAVGETAAIEALVVANPTTEVSSGNVRAQVVHGAPNAPTVDVYVTAVDAVLADEQPLATLSFKDFTEQVEVPAGDYQIRITASGTTTVVYDSGAVTLADGADLLITATENVATGDSPVALLVADGTASSVILDTNAQASLRAIHAIADAPAVDVFADLENADDILLFDNPAFKDVADYISVMGATYAVDVVVAADNTTVAIDDAEVVLENGVRYSALANNTVAMADLDLVVDDGRRLATAAQVRIFHASPSTGGVDIYVTADGDLTDATPSFTNVTYSTDELAETGYVQLPAGDYVVIVTPTGTTTAAIETDVLTLDVGNIYTALAVDGDNTGDAPQLILADDFITPTMN